MFIYLSIIKVTGTKASNCPMPIIETNHDPSAAVIGMGELFANSFGSVGDGQPIAIPPDKCTNVALTK